MARTVEGEERLYQVTYDSSDSNTLEREERALREARRELGLEAQLITPENYATEFLAALPTWEEDQA